MYYNNILETIGNTPLVKLNRIPREKNVKATILGKCEYFNPGNSVKDRIGIRMIEDAEQKGLLKPGGTIIEGTSGNTGMGLALAAISKGYKCIFTTTDKQSKEKLDMLRAVGAEVIVCPTNVEPEDPRSYYSVAKRLSKEIPNSFYPNQYDNLSNRLAHYEGTGPEIWRQTEGKITHFVSGVGTGGTISGTGRFLKEQNPNIKIWGIDTYGSVFKKYHETGEFDHKEIYPYITEGIGEDILPENVDFGVIDLFEKVSDRDSFIMTRRLVREEGILAGNSAGAAVAGLMQLADQLKEDDLVVVLLPDHATRYVAKAFNDEWMRERGFLDMRPSSANDILKAKERRPLITLTQDQTVHDAVALMKQEDIDQLVVVDDKGEFTGALTEARLYSRLLEDPSVRDKKVEDVMERPFPVVDNSLSYQELSGLLNRENPAVLVRTQSGEFGIITMYDVIQTIAG